MTTETTTETNAEKARPEETGAGKKRAAIPPAAALFCAAFMLGVVPLLFNDAFFDINRFKISMICRVVPILVLMETFAVLPRGGEGPRALARMPGAIPSAFMLALMLSCVLSCALAGFEQAVLTGSEGRYFGLYAMLSCGAAFLMIVNGSMSGRMLGGIAALAVLVAAGVSALGILNVMGVDPLRFYAAIQAGQQVLFQSTIGNSDFFGIYLTLLLPLASALFVFGSGRIKRLFGAACAVLIALGVSAARTDSAFVGLHLACAAMVMLAGDDWAALCRALALWAACFLTLPAMVCLFDYSAFAHTYAPQYKGILRILCGKHIASAAALALLIGTALCARLSRRGVKVPGRKRLMIALCAALAVAVLLALGTIAYFTWIAPDAEIGDAASFLRFDDRWGSHRGAVYIRSMRAFAGYDIGTKLAGQGMETTLRALTPYFDDPEILSSGIFNDPHCQPLQFLLTCGLLGFAAFVGLYASLTVALYRHAGRDPLICGGCAALMGYSIPMLLNVTQPILMATYLSVAALALAKVNASALAERGIDHEP